MFRLDFPARELNSSRWKYVGGSPISPQIVSKRWMRRGSQPPILTALRNISTVELAGDYRQCVDSDEHLPTADGAIPRRLEIRPLHRLPVEAPGTVDYVTHLGEGSVRRLGAVL